MAGKGSETLKNMDTTLTRGVMQSKIRQARRWNKIHVWFSLPQDIQGSPGIWKREQQHQMGWCNQGWNGLHQGTRSLHHMPKVQMGFKPPINPKCTSEPPKDQGKLDICCQVQWKTPGKTCGRWFLHPRSCREHLFRSIILEALMPCNVSWRAQQPWMMGSWYWEC